VVEAAAAELAALIAEPIRARSDAADPTNSGAATTNDTDNLHINRPLSAPANGVPVKGIYAHIKCGGTVMRTESINKCDGGCIGRRQKP
jgi:hypothetical protein